MRKVIAITAFNRPDYLREVLASLRENPLEGWELHLSLEPGCPPVREIAASGEFMPTTVHCNATRLGVRDHPFRMLDRVFDSGAELVLYGEDDVLLSPDATRLVSWFGARPDREDYCALCLYNHASATQLPDVVARGRKFASLGLGLTRAQWERHLRPNWYRDGNGWDWSIVGYLAAHPGVATLSPGLSRAHHIGRFGGTFYRTRLHDRLYLDNPWNREARDFAFRLSP